ncbi:MAG: PfkB family carbohydrate kinase [Prolixibacteraceae bacterium]
MNINPKKALFIGLTTIDIQYFVEHYPQANTKIKTDAPLIAVGGPAANAAITYSVLGGQADFLSCIGINSFTQVVRNDFAKYNVRVIDPYEAETTDPIVSAVITTLANSERTIITHHPLELKANDQAPQIDLLDYAFIFIDGFYPELSLQLLPEAKMKHIPVIFDGGSWKKHLPQLLGFVDIAICSGNFHPPQCNTDDDTISYLKSLGINEVAISKGEGCIVCEHSSIAVEPVDAIDSLGAGDVLHGAFCFYMAAADNFIDALSKASKVASFSVQYRGTHAWIKHYNKIKNRESK